MVSKDDLLQAVWDGRIVSESALAAWRYVEFFTANIGNPNTRRAYARACNRFFAWCEDRGLTPAAIRPHDVATYIEQLQIEVSRPARAIPRASAFRKDRGILPRVRSGRLRSELQIDAARSL
jgi:hypothetical protein